MPRIQVSPTLIPQTRYVRTHLWEERVRRLLYFADNIIFLMLETTQTIKQVRSDVNLDTLPVVPPRVRLEVVRLRNGIPVR